MTSIHRPAKLALSIAIAFSALLPLPASAQTSAQQPFPRNNVTGSALATRRPGTWIQSGISTHATRLDASLNAFGGVTISETGPEPSIRDEILPSLVEVLLGALNQLSVLIQSILQGTTIAT